MPGPRYTRSLLFPTGVVASTCSPGDAAWSTNIQSEPATARSSATTDAPKGDRFVESYLYVGGRFEWYCGFDQIELDSPQQPIWLAVTLTVSAGTQ